MDVRYLFFSNCKNCSFAFLSQFTACGVLCCHQGHWPAMRPCDVCSSEFRLSLNENSESRQVICQSQRQCFEHLYLVCIFFFNWEKRQLFQKKKTHFYLRKLSLYKLVERPYRRKEIRMITKTVMLILTPVMIFEQKVKITLAYNTG